MEVSVHGRWWQASNGQTGRVPESQARKGPVAMVAVLAHRFGMDGRGLVDVIGQPRSTSRLSFEPASVTEDGDGQ